MRRSRAPSRAPAISLSSSGVAGGRLEALDDEPTLTDPDRVAGRSYLAAFTVLAVLSALVGFESSTGVWAFSALGDRGIRPSGGSARRPRTGVRDSHGCTAGSLPRSRGRASPGQT